LPGPYEPRLEGVCFRVLASPLHSPRLVAMISDFLAGAAEALGWEGLQAPLAPATGEEEARAAVEGCSAAFIVLATGGTEHLALAALGALKGAPAVVASIPLANSLSSLLELKPVLPPGAAAVHLPSLDPRDPEAVRAFEAAVRGLWAARAVKGLRLGLIGDPSPWLVYSLPRGEALERLGVSLVRVGVDEFVSLVEESGVDEELARRIVEGAESADLAPGEPRRSLRVMEAIRRLARERGLNAVSPACWWFYRRAGANACLAHALLNDSGLVVGCEGDVPATIALALASHASGSPGFLANIADIRGEEVLLAHCTAPYSLGTRYRLMRHFITGGSVTSRVAFKPYKLWTVARLSPDASRLRVALGELVDGDPGREMQCESQLLLRVPGARRLLEESMGNHHVAVPGDVREGLRVASEILGLEYEELGSP